MSQVRVIVALVLANGARIRPVCRTSGCPWRGQAHRTQKAAQHERAIHHAWHVVQAVSSRPVAPLPTGEPR